MRIAQSDIIADITQAIASPTIRLSLIFARERLVLTLLALSLSLLLTTLLLSLMLSPELSLPPLLPLTVSLLLL